MELKYAFPPNRPQPIPCSFNAQLGRYYYESIKFLQTLRIPAFDQVIRKPLRLCGHNENFKNPGFSGSAKGLRQKARGMPDPRVGRRMFTVRLTEGRLASSIWRVSHLTFECNSFMVLGFHELAVATGFWPRRK